MEVDISLAEGLGAAYGAVSMSRYSTIFHASHSDHYRYSRTAMRVSKACYLTKASIETSLLGTASSKKKYEIRFRASRPAEPIGKYVSSTLHVVDTSMFTQYIHRLDLPAHDLDVPNALIPMLVKSL